MKVLLVNLPWINDKNFSGLRAGSRWPHLRMKKEQLPYYPFPFFLAYAAAMLKDGNHEVFLKDCIAEETNAKQFFDFIKDNKPKLVVIETSTPSINEDLKFAKKLKEDFGLITVLTGPHASALPKEIANYNYVDYVIRGEYEKVLRTLVDILDSSKDKDKELLKIKGLYYKKKNSSEVMGDGWTTLIEDLDSMPLPLRDVLPMSKYIDPFCKHAPNLQVVTSRGCPHNCIFCLEPHNFYGKPSYRARSPKKVVDEIEYLIKEYGVKEIYFDDSSFSINKERVVSICKEIIDRDIKIYWSCMADSALDEDTLKWMKRSGCVALKFGVESSSPIILKNIRKKFNPEQAKNTTLLCKKLRIETHATYIFGLPGETKSTIEDTINFAFNLGTDTAQFSIAIPYPGTTFYEMAKKEGWLKADDWISFSGQDVVIEYPHLKKSDLLKAVHKCRKKIMLQVIKNPRQLIQYLNLIYNYAGVKGVLYNISQKVSYLMSRTKSK